MHYEIWRRRSPAPTKPFVWEVVRKISRIMFWLFLLFGLYWTVVRALVAAIKLKGVE